MEAQALTDPDEEKLYHANKIDDVTLLNKKSSVNKLTNMDCDDSRDEKKEKIIVLDVNAAPKSKIIKVTDIQKPLVKKSATADELKNQKEKIKTLQDSIHSNLIKLFHHLKNRHGLNSADDQKEVNEAKEALIADARQMTAMDHDPSPAENFLKGLSNNSLLKSLVHNESKSALVAKDNNKPSASNDSKDQGNERTKQDGDAPVSVQKIEVKHVDKEPPVSTVSSKDKTADNDNKIESSSSVKDEKQSNEHSKESKSASEDKSSKPDNTSEHKPTGESSKTKDVAVTEDKPKNEHHDPYAEIAATPDNPKMPPDVKLPKETPMVPVGMTKPGDDDVDDDKDDDRERRPEGGRGGNGGGSFAPNDLPLPGKTILNCMPRVKSLHYGTTLPLEDCESDACIKLYLNTCHK